MSIARYRSLLLALVSAASIVACAPLSELDEDDEDTEEGDDALKDVVTFDVITHNIAGGMLNFGDPKALNTVEAAIANAKPDAVMLQEVCQTQADAFKASHPAWAIEFRVTRPEHPNCGPLGLILATPHGLSAVDETDLGDADPGKRVILLCGDMKFENRKGTVRICSTHLRAKGKDAVAADEGRAREVLKLVDALRPHVNAGKAVVFAGDINSGPRKELLDPIYRLKLNGNWGGGMFDEADQTDPNREQYRDQGVVCAPNACRSGEPTHDNSKLDHIYFSHNMIAGDIEARVGNKGNSDHNLYRGSAVLALPKKKNKNN
jgi:endonuclease/exonuclease/phosphatase family metal-dependent hydrolase